MKVIYQIEQALLNGHQTRGGIDHYREEGDEEDDEDIGQDAISQPDHKERRHGNFRKGIQENQEGEDGAFQPLRPDNGNAQNHTDQARDQEPSHDFIKSGHEVHGPAEFALEKGLDCRDGGRENKFLHAKRITPKCQSRRARINVKRVCPLFFIHSENFKRHL